MALIDQWSDNFDSKVRERGEEYARQQRVDIVSREPGDRAIEAVVRGTSTYHVTAEKGPSDDLWCQCECPYFYDRHEPCKHIWAAVVTWQRGANGRAAVKRGRSNKKADWRDQFDKYRATLHSFEVEAHQPTPQQILYVIDAEASSPDGALTVEILARKRKRDGDWGKPAPVEAGEFDARWLPDPDDRRILSILDGAPSPYDTHHHARLVAIPLQRELVEQMCATGRAVVKHDGYTERPLRWDGSGAWRFATELITVGANAELVGHLERFEHTLSLDEPLLMTRGGLVFGDDWVAELEDNGAFGWIALLAGGHTPQAPADDADALAGHLLALPTAPPLTPPPALLAGDHDAPPPLPLPHLVIRAREDQGNEFGKRTSLLADLSFEYGEHAIAAGDAASAIFDEAHSRLVPRDRDLERAAVAKLYDLGFQPAEPEWNERFDPDNPPFELAARRLDKAVADLALAGWRIEAAGHVHRQPSAPVSLKVASGIDWFELHGEVDFEGHTVQLPALLEAVRSGQRLVQLDDGSVGMLPAEWLAQLAPVAELGEADGDHIRFKPTQAAVIDALLAASPEADVDAQFAKARQRLREFEKVEAADPPDSFVGELRPYQKEGLGWLHFCREFGFGGCLADDMGLGKTVQVLALLDSRAVLRQSADESAPPPPSIAVVPKSLVHNWVAEAARFTPNLRVLDHTGPLRDRTGGNFDTVDLVVTTYGTLRSDAAMFAERRFDYAVLDEAQAIKNAATASAKAARLLRADHRIAMTGTPIENHLGELWSLFEFLNPGMLGRSRAFKRLTQAASNMDDETAQQRRVLIAATVAPFVLRRTKEQVAPDLPPRTEQTIDCPMEPAQQKLYDELRDHYRASLLKRVATDGLNKSKVHVLEALLRLRQAACHPGLIDDSRRDEPSAKLDMLLERLAEVIDEGHKALVFSQFTSLLSIVRDRLDANGMTYEYLDGKTRDRPARIERFQNDPDQKLFLISLKAGGLGLNLTAADYVFLLDPWWNPAAEAQAIDRTHRIGQTRHVFAYRLITPDTVEQKVLELQQSKRDLADAIISADKGPLSGMTGDELEALLS